MKKFTFLLTLLGLMVGSIANAQTSLSWKKYVSSGEVVTDLSTLQDGGTYAFKSVGKNKFIKIKDNSFDSKQLTNIDALSADNENAGLAVFTFHKKGENTYSFESAWSGYYMQPVVDGSCYLGTAEASFVIRNTNVNNETKEGKGNFCIKNSNNNVWFDMQNDQFVGWQGKDANCWYQIVPVTVENATSVTYYNTTHQATLGEEVLATEKAWYKDGATITTPSAFTDAFNNAYKRSYNYTAITPNYTNTTVSASNLTFNYTVTGTAAPVDFGKTYTLRTRINDNSLKDKSFVKVTSYNNAEVLKANATFTSESVETYSDYKNSLWKFVKSGFGVKILNVGTGKYVKNNGGNAATLDATGSEFYFGNATENNAQFTLKTGGSATAYFGKHFCAWTDGTNNDRMKTWDDAGAYNDKGSNFTIVDIDTSADILAIAKKALKQTLTVTTSSDDSYLTFDASNFSTLLNEAEAATTIDALDAVYNKISTVSATPEENAYYRIANVAAASGKAYLTTGNMIVGIDGSLATAYNANNGIDRKITRTEAASAIVPQLWKFEKIGENYRIRNANTNCAIAFFANGDLDMPVNISYAGTTSIKNVLPHTGSSNNTYWQFANNEQVYGVRGEQYIGTNSDLKNTTNNIWTIQKVTDFTVNVSSVSYASVGYPFATKVTTEGAKAFYATSANDGSIALIEIADGIIPANQGALIWKDGGGDVTLTITNTDKVFEGNIFTASTAKRDGFTQGETYVLAKNSEEKAAFLKSELTVVPANKAYIASGKLPADAGSAIALIFNGGNTTGINNIATSENGNTEYYDLNGRRVLYPSNGIFVTNNGKKVFIK